MISLINHDFQWGRSEVVIIYPDRYIYSAWLLGYLDLLLVPYPSSESSYLTRRDIAEVRESQLLVPATSFRCSVHPLKKKCYISEWSVCIDLYTHVFVIYICVRHWIHVSHLTHQGHDSNYPLEQSNLACWNIYHRVRWFSHFNSQFTKDLPLKPFIYSWCSMIFPVKTSIFSWGKSPRGWWNRTANCRPLSEPSSKNCLGAGVQSRIHQNPPSNISISYIHNMISGYDIISYLYIYIYDYIRVCVSVYICMGSNGVLEIWDPQSI